MKIHVQEYKRRKYYRNASTLFKKVLSTYLADFISRCEGGTLQTIRDQAEKPLSEKPVEDAMIRVYSKVGADFAQATLKELNRKKAHSKAASDNNVTTDFWQEYFKRYAVNKAGAKIKWITGTTEERFKTVVSRIITDNADKGVFDILRQIQNELNIDNQYRAERIARTEVNAASNRGSFDAAKQAGITVRKQWSAVVDENTRESHIANEAEGPIDIDKAFANGQMLPGEGDAADVINCRCGVIYITEDE